MGQLDYRRPRWRGKISRLRSRRKIAWRPVRQIVLAWILPLVLTLAILFGVHDRVKADPAPTATQLQQYLQHNQLGVYVDIANDYPQIFYPYNGQTVQLSDENYPHLHPMASGQYVAWQGVVDSQSQIFLYDVLSDSLLQLSSTGSNEGLYVYDNTVVWQSWDGQYWQIYYYDGTQVQQITSDQASSVRASIDGHQIIYAEQVGTDDWKAQSYDISTGQTSTISEGSTAATAYPHFNDDGSVSTAFVPY
jgi:hypothetical protein